MKIIKEHGGKTCIVRTTTSRSKLGYFLELFENAKKDFPNLDANQVKIIKYEGMECKQTFGIRFNIDSDIPNFYKKVEKWELSMYYKRIR